MSKRERLLKKRGRMYTAKLRKLKRTGAGYDETKALIGELKKTCRKYNAAAFWSLKENEIRFGGPGTGMYELATQQRGQSGRQN